MGGAIYGCILFWILEGCGDLGIMRGQVGLEASGGDGPASLAFRACISIELAQWE